MYPEIRLIGTIQAMEEPIQGKPDRVITVSANLRNGQKGSFRVRMPSRDAAQHMVGDDILVQGELDELGTIHPSHGGILRKLAPASIPSVPQPTNVATPHTQAMAAVPPRAPQMNRQTSAQQPSRATPSFLKPAATQNGRLPFGTLFGAGKGPAPKPAPTPVDVSSAREAPRATYGGTTRDAGSPSKTFGSARPDRPQTPNAMSSSGGTAANKGEPRQSWDVDQPTRAAASPRKPKSDLAEYLQDDIPW